MVKWAGVENRITLTYEIVWTFREVRGYYPTYTYETKRDPFSLLRKSHPADIILPQTAHATETDCKRPEKQQICNTPGVCNTRRRKLQLPDLYNIATKKNAKVHLQLCHHAVMELYENENPLLSHFFMTRDDKRRNDMETLYGSSSYWEK